MKLRQSHMARLIRFLAMAPIAGCAFPGCGKLVGLDTPVTPLARIRVQFAGYLPATAGPLRVALVWGAQWLPEPFCVAPPKAVPAVVQPGWKLPSVDDVVAAGCPDNFRFVPDRAGADIPIQPDVPPTIDLINLPAADVMVGDVTARIAYASVVVYYDRNGNGTLDFHHPPHHQDHEEDYNPGTPATSDVVFGASFISMTKPDQRVAFREGEFDANVAFYPRIGCDNSQPLPGFSILSAGGFDASLALQGQLPTESDPAACAVATLDDAVVTILLSAPTADAGAEGDARAEGNAGAQDEYYWSRAELACTDPETGGMTFYLQPDTSFDFTSPNMPPWACVGFPRLSGDTAEVASGQQLVIANAGPCKSVIHFILRGCANDPHCAAPSWDLAPPAWWPCSTTP
jgi:hypothetical protein